MKGIEMNIGTWGSEVTESSESIWVCSCEAWYSLEVQYSWGWAVSVTV
jgi:hypothetical protein